MFCEEYSLSNLTNNAIFQWFCNGHTISRKKAPGAKLQLDLGIRIGAYVEVRGE